MYFLPRSISSPPPTIVAVVVRVLLLFVKRGDGLDPRREGAMWDAAYQSSSPPAAVGPFMLGFSPLLDNFSAGCICLLAVEKRSKQFYLCIIAPSTPMVGVR
jgi:hypothetical protein